MSIMTERTRTDLLEVVCDLAPSIRASAEWARRPPDALADADVVWPSFSGHDPAELLALGGEDG